jgi:tRNA-dihydrouridine synthase C
VKITQGTPALILAPMEGVTDAPMRAFLSERGGFSFCVSEFLRVSQDIPPPKTFYKHIPELLTDAKTAAGLPVHVQLLGGDPEKMAQTALIAIKCGAQAIDINFGCPAPTVNRHDGGATLLKFPDRIYEIVKAVRAAVPQEFPVSAKLRLGWDSIDDIDRNAESAAKGGAAWITVHGRTKFQGYTPPAYWGPIGRVHKALGIPVVANGEIWTLDDFKRCREQTGAEHFMIGRGALADPSLQYQIARELGIPLREKAARLDEDLSNTPENWIPLLVRFAELTSAHFERIGKTEKTYVSRRIKQWFRFVHLRFADSPSGAAFERIKRVDTLQEMIDALQDRAPVNVEL